MTSDNGPPVTESPESSAPSEPIAETAPPRGDNAEMRSIRQALKTSKEESKALQHKLEESNAELQALRAKTRDTLLRDELRTRGVELKRPEYIEHFLASLDPELISGDEVDTSLIPEQAVEKFRKEFPELLQNSRVKSGSGSGGGHSISFSGSHDLARQVIQKG